MLCLLFFIFLFKSETSRQPKTCLSCNNCSVFASGCGASSMKRCWMDWEMLRFGGRCKTSVATAPLAPFPIGILKFVDLCQRFFHQGQGNFDTLYVLTRRPVPFSGLSLLLHPLHCCST